MPEAGHGVNCYVKSNGLQSTSDGLQAAKILPDCGQENAQNKMTEQVQTSSCTLWAKGLITLSDLVQVLLIQVYNIYIYIVY